MNEFIRSLYDLYAMLVLIRILKAGLEYAAIKVYIYIGSTYTFAFGVYIKTLAAVRCGRY